VNKTPLLNNSSRIHREFIRACHIGGKAELERREMDPILYWNDVALEANRVSHTRLKGEQRGPTLSSRALAIVHLAMYDAFVGASQAALTPYLTQKPNAASSESAAVAAAAHATLSHLFPSQKPFFDLKHAQAGVSGSKLKQGHEFGLLVAKNLLADRKDDPGAGDDGYASSTQIRAITPPSWCEVSVLCCD
jgi:hypothetical protein